MIEGGALKGGKGKALGMNSGGGGRGAPRREYGGEDLWGRRARRGIDRPADELWMRLFAEVCGEDEEVVEVDGVVG